MKQGLKYVINLLLIERNKNKPKSIKKKIENFYASQVGCIGKGSLKVFIRYIHVYAISSKLFKIRPQRMVNVRFTLVGLRE